MRARRTVLLVSTGMLGAMLGPITGVAAATPAPRPRSRSRRCRARPTRRRARRSASSARPRPNLHDIRVVGSRSGAHPGRLAPYETAAGASFLPSRGFDEGEQVTVTAVVGSGAARRRIGTSFTIAHLYSLPSEPLPKRPADSPADVQGFHSRHDLSPPVVDVTVPASNPSAGDIFITSATGPGQDGPMILEPNGALVWFKPVPDGRQHDATCACSSTKASPC